MPTKPNVFATGCMVISRSTRAMPARRLLPLLGVLALVAASSEGRAATAGDARDQPYLSTIISQALETERTKVEIPWSNPETGNRGVMVIERTWYRDPQSPCRDYRWTLERGDRSTETISGTGCRIGPAVWRLDERPASADPVDPALARSPSVAASPPAPAATPPRAPKAAAAPVRKQASSASATPPAAAVDTTTAKPAKLPTYTLPSKTAM